MKYKVYDDNKKWVEFDDPQQAVMYAKDNLLDGEFVYHRNKGEDWHTVFVENLVYIERGEVCGE